jgi:hypothetical protein
MSRPHPLGLTAHPEWDRVEDRYNELWSNAALRQMRCAPEPEPRPIPAWAVRAVVITAEALVCAGFAGLFWAAFL